MGSEMCIRDRRRPVRGARAGARRRARRARRHEQRALWRRAGPAGGQRACACGKRRLVVVVVVVVVVAAAAAGGATTVCAAIGRIVVTRVRHIAARTVLRLLARLAVHRRGRAPAGARMVSRHASGRGGRALVVAAGARPFPRRLVPIRQTLRVREEPLADHHRRVTRAQRPLSTLAPVDGAARAGSRQSEFPRQQVSQTVEGWIPAAQ